MELNIDPNTWARTKHKLRNAYILTEQSFQNVKLLDVICTIISDPAHRSELSPIIPIETQKLQLGYQVLAEIGGKVVTTTGYWEDIVDMTQKELDDDAMARVSQWVLALSIMEGKHLAMATN